MDMTRYTLLHDDDVVRIAAFGDAAPDADALLAAVGGLSLDAPPDGVELIYHNAPAYKWGRTAFLLGGMFVKALWTGRHRDRLDPFAGVSAILGNWERCRDLGLPVPEYLGAFARLVPGEGWMWNGVVARNLAGWRTLDAAEPADQELLRRAEAAFAAKGVRNPDLSPSNVMTDGEGDFRVVDLDVLEFADE